MIKKCGKCYNLIATTSVLELTEIKTIPSPEQIVDFTRLDVIGETRDKESVDVLLFVLRVNIVGIVGWVLFLVYTRWWRVCDGGLRLSWVGWDLVVVVLGWSRLRCVCCHCRGVGVH